MTEFHSKLYSSAQTHLRQLRKLLQVEECRNKSVENFSLQEFFIKLDNAVKEISQTSTQLAKAHRKSSLSNFKELQELINCLEAASDNLVFVFHSLPEELGRRFYLDMLKMTKGILTALVDFIQSLNLKESKSARETLKYTENVYSKCEEVQKMPKNNLESVLRFLHREELLLLDALQEIDEEVKSNFSGLKYGEEIDNTEMWNNQDRELLPPCVALVKTARLCLKKVIAVVKSKGDCSTPTNIKQMDEIAFIVEDLTQKVDTFVSAIYPPMNQRDVKQDALKVVNTIQNLLTRVQNSHFVQEIDQSWLTALFKSVDHNNNKLQPLFSDEILVDSSETDKSDDEDDDDDDEDDEDDDDDDDDDDDEEED